MELHSDQMMLHKNKQGELHWKRTLQNVELINERSIMSEARQKGQKPGPW